MEEITICKECEFAEKIKPESSSERTSYSLSQSGKSGISGYCLNTDAPLYDFVFGLKLCSSINYGHCQFFKSRTKDE